MAKSIMQDKKECYFCSREWGLQTHHVMNGRPYRKYSEQDGLKVYLCYQCHGEIHRNAEMRITLKAKAQEAWMDHYGTAAAFRGRYGKNYRPLDE